MQKSRRFFSHFHDKIEENGAPIADLDILTHSFQWSPTCGCFSMWVFLRDVKRWIVKIVKKQSKKTFGTKFSPSVNGKREKCSNFWENSSEFTTTEISLRVWEVVGIRETLTNLLFEISEQVEEKKWVKSFIALRKIKKFIPKLRLFAKIWQKYLKFLEIIAFSFNKRWWN